MSEAEERVKKAIEFAVKYHDVGGSLHAPWVTDQMVRILAGDRYDEIVREAKNGAEGPNTYPWDIGVSP